MYFRREWFGELFYFSVIIYVARFDFIYFLFLRFLINGKRDFLSFLKYFLIVIERKIYLEIREGEILIGIFLFRFYFKFFGILLSFGDVLR